MQLGAFARFCGACGGGCYCLLFVLLIATQELEYVKAVFEYITSAHTVFTAAFKNHFTASGGS